VGVNDAVLPWDHPSWRERDTRWAAGCRWLQAWWRDQVLALPAGPISPGRPDRLVATMLPVGADRGQNFLGDDVVRAVEERLAEGQHSGIVDKHRLYRNLLSSQPACFNLFGPFLSDPAALLGWVRWLDPEAVQVERIRFEWAPDRKEHFDGGSAFDAFIEYRAAGPRFLAVECKYAENLAMSGIKVRDVYPSFTASSPDWRPGAVERLDTPRLRQLWLNTLLAQSLVQKDPRWEHGTVTVVACRADQSAEAATALVRDELVEPDRWLRWSPYEAVLEGVDGHNDWAYRFRRRYLDFAPVQHLLPAGDPRRVPADQESPGDPQEPAEEPDEGMWVTVNPDGTLDIENVVPPEIEAEYAEYEQYLDSLTSDAAVTGRPFAAADPVHDRIRGCLMAGAVGDALGAPVEFWPLQEIRDRLGPAGVTSFVDGRAEVTDDTQMTLFTAEGMIRAAVRYRAKGICNPASVVFFAYKRWLCTQHVGREPEPDGPFDGWLVAETRLHHRRAPGKTCLSAIAAGWHEVPIRAANDSKGCGAVMRVAPVGLIADSPETAFRLGCETAATTHGHPSGWLPAGVLAATINLLRDGAPLPDALQIARQLLAEHNSDNDRPATGETAAAIDAALAQVRTGPPTPERVEQLGGGWVGEEALAIACYCALAAPDPRSALLAAVNHSGDSDSTGSICGNLLGAAHGTTAAPDELFAQLDLADVIVTISDDLWHEISVTPGDSDGIPSYWWARYPGW
jgi:ADP-ribosylglycohydrolase